MKSNRSLMASLALLIALMAPMLSGVASAAPLPAVLQQTACTTQDNGPQVTALWLANPADPSSWWFRFTAGGKESVPLSAMAGKSDPPSISARWIAPEDGTWWYKFAQDGTESVPLMAGSATPTNSAEAASLINGCAESITGIAETDEKGVTTMAWLTSKWDAYPVPFGFAEVNGVRYGPGSSLWVTNLVWRPIAGKVVYSYPKGSLFTVPPSEPVTAPVASAPAPAVAVAVAASAPPANCTNYNDLAGKGQILQVLKDEKGQQAGGLVKFTQDWTGYAGDVVQIEGGNYNGARAGQTASVWINPECRPVTPANYVPNLSAPPAASAPATSAQAPATASSQPAAQVNLPACPSNSTQVAKILLNKDVEDDDVRSLANGLSQLGKPDKNGWKYGGETERDFMARNDTDPIRNRVIQVEGKTYDQSGVWSPKARYATIWFTHCVK